MSTDQNTTLPEKEKEEFTKNGTTDEITITTPKSPLPKNTSLKNTKRLWMGLRTAETPVNEAKFMFFYGRTFNEYRNYSLDEARLILQHPKFDATQKTVLYIHGYIESPADESQHVIADAYLKRNDHNLILLDWQTLADGNYLMDAVQNSKALGPKLAEVLLDMFDNGLDLALFHLVGHSLGGQMSGLIGRSIRKRSNDTKMLMRITALDPAFPPFYPAIGVTAISDKDAVFVDVIHTDAWLYGAPVRTGTADFWPNSGRSLQPGCPRRNYRMLSDNDLCSHRRSWRFWAESVEAKDTPSFHSVRAKSWSDFKKGRIEDTTIVQMGIDCPMNAKGDYYLQTNGQKPYSRSINGVNYEVIENIVIDNIE